MSLRNTLITTTPKNSGDKATPALSLRGTLTRAAAGGSLAIPDKRTSLPSLYSEDVAIGFIIDATGSRSAMWEEAQGIQARTFSALGNDARVKQRLLHFGGDHLTDRGWTNDSKVVTRAMADVRCVSGQTQILPALEAFLDGQRPKAGTIMLIGDAFEESQDAAAALAEKLDREGIKVFAFLEGNNETAANAFKMFADRTGGKFANFGKDMPLPDLCRAVALQATGGSEALKALADRGDKAARLLLAYKPA